MNVVVFSGTTEGRSFSRALAALGAAVTVCVATELGAEEQGCTDGITVRTGRLDAEGMTALLRGAEEGARLALTLAGPLCLWSGFAALLEVNGWSRLLARGLRPLLRRLFPRAMDDEICAGALCGNLSANLLGLGNAATPLGVRAVQQMKVRSGGDAASDEMCMLIVMNTASMQLLPTTVASVRAGLGAAKPFEILVPVWLASVCSVGAGIFAAKVLRRFL